ncbi:hypothetical protein PT974_00547 [Cladobotryum mycophilum]|uniref:Nodulin-like domain-containing protein n=1 Tax=Cladobotryum mycophilum TaxID=491253 RepID=A0ABR0T2B8_9HYPO
MHQDPQMLRGRLIASVAATVISLACGTNYVYSAWAPQFADRLKLSATESNLIGLFGNLGMYSMGVPIGMFVDHRGPRPAVLAGAILLAIGYFPLHQAFDRASGSIPILCFFSYLTGLGGCMAFAGAVKTSALNWPRHRGTATAFPLAGFGLSAFFFSMFGALLFPGNPSAFLMLLSWGTFSLTLAGYFFLNVYSHASYQVLPGLDSNSQSFTVEESHQDLEPGTSFTSPTTHNTAIQSHTPSVVGAPGGITTHSPNSNVVSDGDESLVDETSPLISSTSVAEIVGRNSVDRDRSYRIDIRGLRLLATLDFWQLFAIMAILAGTGLMTINNIGNNANALWRYYDKTVDDDFLLGHRQMHVSILSVCSFLGRLLSGIGSDFLIKTLQASRIWCLATACAIFLLAQLCAISISNPHFLGLISSMSGLAYGMLFGVFPSIVAETFGIRGLSQNWGFMTLAPVASSNVFNLFYGMIYDRHSVIQPGGQRICEEGLNCYREAYFVTCCACIVGLLVTLWVIHHQQAVRLKETKKWSRKTERKSFI